jgi:hypothetical protein
MSTTIAVVPRSAYADDQAEQPVIDEIIALRDASLEVNKMEFAKLFKQLQNLYAKGGRKAQFSKRIEELGFARRTVYRWMDEYDAEVSHKPKKDSVPFGTESSQPTQNEELTEKSHGSSESFTDRAVEEVDRPSTTAHEPVATIKPLLFDTPEKRKKFMFEQAVLALKGGNVYTESLRNEWAEVDQRVRQWLDSFAIVNTVPSRDINQVRQRKQEN